MKEVVRIIGYTTLEELEGLTIGVQLGSIQQDAAEELGEEYGFEVKPFDRIPETVQELQTGYLKDSEMHYRSLVEHIPETITVHDGTRFIYMNPAGVKLIKKEIE